MARSTQKKDRPVRKLFCLALVVFLLYGVIGFNVVQLHWDDIFPPVQEEVTDQVADESEASEDGATDQSDDEPSQSGDDQAAEPAEGEQVTPQPTEEATPAPEAGATGEDSTDNAEQSSEATDDTNASDETPAETPEETPAKKSDPVGFVPKFALDLAGGTQLILKAETEDGSVPDDNAIDRAIDVIRQRVDASGVSEAEISRQGAENIVVGIPGEKPSDETVKLISRAARMRFRPVITIGAAQTKYYTAALGTKSTINQAQSGTADQSDIQKFDLDGDGQLNEEESRAYIESANDKDKTAYETEVNSDTAKGTSKFSVVTDEDIKKFDDMDCSAKENLEGGGGDDPEKPLVTCSQDGTAKYMLAPVAVEGEGIDRAQAGLKQLPNGKQGTDWVVSLQFKDYADDQFIAISEQVKVLDQPRNQFAICLDGLVISAPSIQKDTTFVKGNGVEISSGQSTDGTNETRPWANTLANQLSFGALPMNFHVESNEQVSASLGSEQLEKGLLAGILGLLLVIFFSLFQYRALGLVTVGSLGVAALLTYGIILFLSWQMEYRLSLPGIIGLIVAIGITADSFIVYFERIRDELRDGRSLDMAVTRGWKRALQTILASDTVNVLCAVILYLLAVGGVRGFAFTLGLTTAVDLIVVMLFTHPLVQLLSKMRFFKNGHPASGLSAFNLGADNAQKYRNLTVEERKELDDQRKAEVLEARNQREAVRSQKLSAKKLKRKQRELSRIQQREYVAEMELKSSLLQSGADEDDVINAELTLAQRKALAQGVDVQKVLAMLSDDDSETSPKVSDVGSEKVPPKESATKVASKTTVKPVAKPVAKSSPGKKVAPKAVGKKAPAKTTAKTATKPATKSKTTAKTTATKSAPKSVGKTTEKVAKKVTKPAAKPSVKKKVVAPKSAPPKSTQKKEAN